MTNKDFFQALEDLEKLKDAIFWIDKYGRIPNVNGTTLQEVRKAVTLKRIQEKYIKYIGNIVLL